LFLNFVYAAFAGVCSDRRWGITSSANKRIDPSILSYAKPGRMKNSK